MKFFGWFSAITFGLLGLGALLEGHFSWVFFLLVFAILAVPGVFERVSKPWKMKMEALHGEGSGKLVRPLVVLGLSWVFVVLMMAPDPDASLNQVDAVEPAEPLGGHIDQSNIAAHNKPYKVVDATDTSFAGRERRKYFIVATEPMASPEDYLFTGIQAAQDIAKSSNAKVISVFFEADARVVARGQYIVRVNHYVDGLGNSGSDETPVWSVSLNTPLPTQRQIDFMAKVAQTHDAAKDLPYEEYEKKMGEVSEPANPSDVWISEHAEFDVSTEVLELTAPTELSLAQVDDFEKAFCAKKVSCFFTKEMRSKSLQKCRAAVESLARYDHEWLVGMFTASTGTFPVIRGQKEDGFVLLMGNKIKFQNGYGAFQQMNYACKYNFIFGTVLDVGAEPMG